MTPILAEIEVFTLVQSDVPASSSGQLSWGAFPIWSLLRKLNKYDFQAVREFSGGGWGGRQSL